MTSTCATAHHPTVAFRQPQGSGIVRRVTSDVPVPRGHRYTLDFPNTTPAAPGTARELVRKHAPASVAYAAELAASELVTNAARHAPGAARLCMTISAAMLVLSVTDQHPETSVVTPDPADASNLDAESGRGLAILAALGAELAVRCDAGRKRVTARLPIPDEGNQP